MQLAKEIEKLDPAYSVTMKANKPEMEKNARLG
jgi:dynactin complex subunit